MVGAAGPQTTVPYTMRVPLLGVFGLCFVCEPWLKFCVADLVFSIIWCHWGSYFGALIDLARVQFEQVAIVVVFIEFLVMLLHCLGKHGSDVLHGVVVVDVLIVYFSSLWWMFCVVGLGFTIIWFDCVSLSVSWSWFSYSSPLFWFMQVGSLCPAHCALYCRSVPFKHGRGKPNAEDSQILEDYQMPGDCQILVEEGVEEFVEEGVQEGTKRCWQDKVSKKEKKNEATSQGLHGFKKMDDVWSACKVLQLTFPKMVDAASPMEKKWGCCDTVRQFWRSF